jgi:small subunit ribosomal protein S35
MGEEHPAAAKVVVEFCTADLPDLTEVQRNKLIKLSGTRYNPDTDIVKMSSENFETQMQNKRYLLDTINNLISEAKDPKDTFEDIPFDFRHHKRKTFHAFPSEWILTEDRKKYLAARRSQEIEEEAKRIENKKLVDGKAIIDGYLKGPEMAMPQMVMANRTNTRRLPAR